VSKDIALCPKPVSVQHSCLRENNRDAHKG
jgi:hypothetical protein